MYGIHTRSNVVYRLRSSSQGRYVNVETVNHLSLPKCKMTDLNVSAVLCKIAPVLPAKKPYDTREGLATPVSSTDDLVLGGAGGSNRDGSLSPKQPPVTET